MTTIIACDHGIFTDTLATVNDSPLNTGNAFVRKALVGEYRNYVLAWSGSPEFLPILGEAIEDKISFIKDEEVVPLSEEIKGLFDESTINAGVLMLPPEEGTARLFYIAPNGAIRVHSPLDPVFLGSGAEFAKGAWFALDKSTSLPYEEKVKRAMGVAADLDYYTGGPYIFGYKWIPDEGFFEFQISMDSYRFG